MLEIRSILEIIMTFHETGFRDAEKKDAIDSYFECVTACSIEDQEVECVTRCVELHLKSNNE